MASNAGQLGELPSVGAVMQRSTPATLIPTDRPGGVGVPKRLPSGRGLLPGQGHDAKVPDRRGTPLGRGLL